jgi:YHS domain-containing protein
MVDNKKDPTCGMPVTAGINDTAHYENKVLGFCSTECKNEFLKNPKANIAAAELK